MAQSRAVWSADLLDPLFFGFREHLTGSGFAPATVAYRLRICGRFSDWLEAAGRPLKVMDEDDVESFIAAQQRASYAGQSYGTALSGLLAFLREAERIPTPPVFDAFSPGPVDELVERWRCFLSLERGLQGSTVSTYTRYARLVLDRLVKDGELQLSGRLTAEWVTDFLLDRRPGITRSRAKGEGSILRGLLRFLHGQGLIGAIEGVVPAVFSHRDSGIPKVLTPAEVEQITRAAGAFPLTRYRDLAVILLFSTLGLRSKEVADMLLEDIDWRSGTVRVRSKGGYIDFLPLPAQTGRALADYLVHDTHRGPGERHVFHRLVGSFGSLTSGALGSIVNSASERAGLGAVGAHRFRHTVASRALNAGASMEEVSQLLRHRSLASTSIYAKVDFERLALVVRPWPAPITTFPGGGS